MDVGKPSSVPYSDRPGVQTEAAGDVHLDTVAVAILTFGSGLLGLYLQKRLPQTHLSGGSKDMILAVIGLLTYSSRWSSAPLSARLWCK